MLANPVLIDGSPAVRGLKILVVVMGVMILAGFAFLIVVILGRMSRPPPTAAPAPTATVAPASASQPYAAAPLDLPAGARIEAMTAGPDRLVIDVVLPDGNRQLLVIDLTTGRRLGEIPLRVSP